MSLLRCRRCDASIDDSLLRCPHCNALVIHRAAEREGSRDLGCGTVGLAMVGALALMGALWSELQGNGNAVTHVFLFGPLIFGAFAVLSQGGTGRNAIVSGLAVVGAFAGVGFAVLAGIVLLVAATCH